MSGMRHVVSVTSAQLLLPHIYCYQAIFVFLISLQHLMHCKISETDFFFFWWVEVQ